METQDKDCSVGLATALHYVECIETIHRYFCRINNIKTDSDFNFNFAFCFTNISVWMTESLGRQAHSF